MTQHLPTLASAKLGFLVLSSFAARQPSAATSTASPYRPPEKIA
ncbi:hypothetical protein [Pseudomonas fluorescens]|nr:hypothetical protein [Pseudomonas fluorescens]